MSVHPPKLIVVIIPAVLCAALIIFLVAVSVICRRHERLVTRAMACPARRNRVLNDAIDLEIIGGGGDAVDDVPAPPPAYCRGHATTETPPQYTP